MFVQTFHNVTCISTVLSLLPTCTQTHRLSDRQIPPQQPKQQYIYARSRPSLPACRALPAPRQPRHPVPGQGLGHPALASLLPVRLEPATAWLKIPWLVRHASDRQRRPLGQLSTPETFKNHILLIWLCTRLWGHPLRGWRQVSK